jgi:RNA polymerase sigma-70 factor, ECF subfamily
VQRDLVERAQRGDREAFGLIVDASLGRLYNLAQLMLADGDLAQDAVQEALIQAWRDLRALRNPDRFDPWLHRILVRCVYRAARGERRQVDRWQLVQTDVGSAPDPARELANRDEIDRCFRRLKADHRAVLVVRHYLGLQDEEAADLLGVPPGTYKSRLHRASAALRAEIDSDARTDVPVRSGVTR